MLCALVRRTTGTHRKSGPELELLSVSSKFDEENGGARCGQKASGSNRRDSNLEGRTRYNATFSGLWLYMYRSYASSSAHASSPSRTHGTYTHMHPPVPLVRFQYTEASGISSIPCSVELLDLLQQRVRVRRRLMRHRCCWRRRSPAAVDRQLLVVVVVIRVYHFREARLSCRLMRCRCREFRAVHRSRCIQRRWQIGREAQPRDRPGRG